MTSSFWDLEEDGVDPGNPPANHVRLYPKNGRLRRKNSSGGDSVLGLPDGTVVGQQFVWDGTTWVATLIDDSFLTLVQGDGDFDDFNSGSVVSVLGWTTLASGTGATAVTTTTTLLSDNRWGIATFVLGTTATGRSGVGITPFANLGGCPVTIEISIYIDTLSAALEAFRLQVGLGDQTASATDQTNGVYFEHDQTTGNWKFCVADNGTAIRTTSTTAVVTGAWIDLKIMVNAAGNLAEFFVNDVLIGTHTTGLPLAAGRNVGFVIRANKTVGTTSRSFSCDYFGYAFGPYTTPR
jgi:hypothetical protein